MKTKLALIFLLLFASITGELSAESKQLKVGGIVALSGPASVHGESIRNGLLLAKEDLEAKGVKVDLAIEDDGSNSTKTVSAIQNLAAKDYKLFIGMTWSFQAEAAAPVVKRLKTLGFAPACSSEIAGGPNSAMLFGTSPSTEKIPILIEWFKTHGVKRASMMYAASGWGTVHENIFREACTKAGVEVVSVDTYNYGDEASSIPSLVTKLRSTKPEVLFITGSKEGTSITAKSLAEQKISIKIVGTDDAKDAALAGILPALPREVELFYITLPITPDFRRRYEEKFHVKPYVYADSAYDGMMMFNEALQKTDGTTESVRGYMISQMSYSGLSGPVRFDSNGDVHKGLFKILPINEE